jgi:hypothetical protein
VRCICLQKNLTTSLNFQNCPALREMKVWGKLMKRFSWNRTESTLVFWLYTESGIK